MNTTHWELISDFVFLNFKIYIFNKKYNYNYKNDAFNGFARLRFAEK